MDNTTQSIIETTTVLVSYDENENKIVNEYFFKETIGKGAYSKVKRAMNLQTKKEYAVKILNVRLLKKKKKTVGTSSEGTIKINYMIEDAMNEIKLYKSLPAMNDNILKLYEILIDEKKEKIYLVMELAEWGTIVSLDENNGVFSINPHFESYDEKIIKGFIIDISKGIQFCKMNTIYLLLLY